ncbi:unnamed protein product [Adineta ricciae]|uniref:Uncharacterized protein n=2 Tax=Adineta ricciae TaxID=249248 RepID=A0A813TIM9_ADIRI|nr:unnamed protein product [Adineta ricciae]
MYEPHFDDIADANEETELTITHQSDTNTSPAMLSPNSSRPTIHWGPVVEGDFNEKEQINTDTDHFDALFARSNAAPSHPRCYSSCSPANAPPLLSPESSTHLTAKSQPLLSSSPSSKPKTSSDVSSDTAHRTSISSSPPKTALQTNPPSARTKRKNFSLTHTAQTFLQASNSQIESVEPLARSCSYKRPQSIKKYRQKKEKEKEKEKDKEQQKQQDFLTRKYSATNVPQNNCASHTGASDSSRKSISGTTGRISVTEPMTSADDSQDQWSNQNTQRSERLGSLTVDQLQLPTDGDEQIYLVRQFHTTSKGFVNRGDSFKRSIKRSGSTSRRSSFRVNTNLTTADRTSSPEHDLNHSPTSPKEIRTSTNSLTNSPGLNLNGILDTHFIENNPLQLAVSTPDQNENDEDEDDDNPLVERIQTEDGRVQDVHVYQVYLLGMSGTGKCSLMRQFKTTEYRGIYDYSSSLDDDPDNTVPIMLDGIESRLHITTIDIDQVKSSVTGDAYIVVYSITDRQSFQTAIQLVKNLRENELVYHPSSIKRPMPIILVGNKSDLVRKRSVTKETARHAAFKHNCKFVETSAAINDKVDDLLAGTLKQIRINEHIRNELKRRLTITNGSIDTNDSDTPILTNTSSLFSARNQHDCYQMLKI